MRHGKKQQPDYAYSVMAKMYIELPCLMVGKLYHVSGLVPAQQNSK